MVFGKKIEKILKNNDGKNVIIYFLKYIIQILINYQNPKGMLF